MSTHVVACWLYGGILLPCAIGAVVDPFWGFQTPLSGQVSPVRAVVPIGLRMLNFSRARSYDRDVKIYQYENVVKIYRYSSV
jgi:hypothetical protein